METHPAKRIEIIIEAPLARRLTDALTEAGVPGYTVLPVLGGYGQSGRWTRDGQVSAASGMVAVVAVVSEDKVEGLLDASFAMVERHIGIVSVSDVSVVRPERF